MNFSGGSISSNGGALLLREVDRRMGLTAAVVRALGERCHRGKVRHQVLTMVRQRVHAVGKRLVDPPLRVQAASDTHRTDHRESSREENRRRG